MQHIEFLHRDHFERDYHRITAKASLRHFIGFFWETDFEQLFDRYPAGFRDILFPDLGYTYLINLGTPFTMQLNDEAYEIRSDGFLPRHKNITCHHSSGNKIFGIKFRVSPVVFERKLDFSEYKEFIFPLSYLIDRNIVEKIRHAANFGKRVDIISHYYDHVLKKHAGTLGYVSIVTEILQSCFDKNNFNISVRELANEYSVSTRTLQRYFDATTSISSKRALQLMRVRKALQQYLTSPGDFRHGDFGYYDYSHFYRHITQFLQQHKMAGIRSHLQLLEGK